MPISYNTYDALTSEDRTLCAIFSGQNVRMKLSAKKSIIERRPNDRLVEARKAAGFATPTAAANAFRDINQHTLISHENGHRDLSRQAARKYGAAFGVNPGWLLFDEDDATSQEARSVPVISAVSAGALRDQDGVSPADITRWIKVGDLPAGDWIALVVDGDSMDRVAPEGALLVVNRADDRLLDGRYYIFSQGGGAATFKRWRRDPDRLQPFSTNPDHISIPVMEDLYVFGRVRRVIQDI